MAPSSLSSDFRIKQTVPRVPAADQPHRHPVSGRIGPYELIEEIARGGMGVVYAARHESGQRIALKVMREARDRIPRVAERFRREAEAMAQIRHPNIVQIHQLGQHGEQLFLVMDFVQGGTLGDHLKRFLADRLLTVRTLIKVARAVHHAHQLGILHRDLKPSNVLLDEQDEPKVTDFGLAKIPASAPELSRDGELIGTPAYMSPEQAAGHNEQIGPATDVWGLGVILYELLTGLRPFPGGDQTRMLFAIQTARPLPPRQIRPLLEPTLERIILRCLEKNPARRYPSAAALADDLERYERGEPVPWLASRKRRFWQMVASFALFVTAIALTLTCISLRGHTSPADQAAAALQAKWQRGEKVVLLGDGNLPAWHRWPLGRPQTVSLQPLTFDAYSPCLLELVPSIPGPRYRIGIEEQLGSRDEGDSGLYFAHHEGTTAEGRIHFLCTVLHRTLNRSQRLTFQVFRYHESDRSSVNSFHSGVLWDYPLPDSLASASDWQDFGIERTEEQIGIFWKDQRIGNVPWCAVVEMTNHLARMAPPVAAPARFSPFLPAGVYVRRGNGVFRNFHVEPVE